MSALTSPPNSTAPAQPVAPVWTDPVREAAFQGWLTRESSTHGLLADSVRLASADASFRRYFRIDRAAGAGSCIIMDAPPALENSAPFVRVAALMRDAGLHVPQILAWDEAAGFMLLSDLGTQTLMDVIDRERPQANALLFGQATDALIAWQLASKPGVLPPYDEALLRRELALFPDWYLTRHKGVAVEGKLRETLDHAFNLIVAHNQAAPQVYVHRDFMPRNLMIPAAPGTTPATQLGGTVETRLGVLDFQDAVYGPITYDIASLTRDAFLSWDEDFVLDVTIRYWEKARKAGLMDFEDWHSDFGAFYRSVEWMGLQRHLKVAGIFTRLTLRDGKPRYLADAPRFLGYIRATAHRYRQLGPLLRWLDEIEGAQAASGYAFGRM